MRAIVAGLCSVVSACASYDFEPVTPLAVGQSIKVVDIGANPLKPNMFLVVDKSGSMKGPVDPACVGMGCLSRLASVQQAMDSFLTTSGNIAHLGMVTFPSDALCGPGDLTMGVPLDVGNDDDARLAQSALLVKAQLDMLSPNGGTPTGATMASLLSIDGLHARDHSNYAVLLTDGAPNCNSANDAATCTCTDPAFQGHCAVGAANECFDDVGSASQIALLADKSIKTIVIGFGADVSGSAGATALQAMAAAGGFVRPCQTDTDCGAGDTCSAGGVDVCGRPASTCGRNFFQASDATSLGAAMDAIRESVTCPPCFQPLNSRPSDPKFVSVLINGTAVAPGPQTWTYVDSATSPAVEFNGSTCAELMVSTPANPVHIEIRSVQDL